MAYLIQMRTVPTEGEPTTLAVLSDADNLSDALDEALAAVRAREGVRSVQVLRQERVEYAPPGSRDHMPDHDVYASAPTETEVAYSGQDAALRLSPGLLHQLIVWGETLHDLCRGGEGWKPEDEALLSLLREFER